jgi:hypothetical protein
VWILSWENPSKFIIFQFSKKKLNKLLRFSIAMIIPPIFYYLGNSQNFIQTHCYNENHEQCAAATTIIIITKKLNFHKRAREGKFRWRKIWKSNLIKIFSSLVCNAMHACCYYLLAIVKYCVNTKGGNFVFFSLLFFLLLLLLLLYFISFYCTI